jgi:hypothetical protein
MPILGADLVTVSPLPATKHGVVLLDIRNLTRRFQLGVAHCG